MKIEFLIAQTYQLPSSTIMLLAKYKNVHNNKNPKNKKSKQAIVDDAILKYIKSNTR